MPDNAKIAGPRIRHFTTLTPVEFPAFQSALVEELRLIREAIERLAPPVIYGRPAPSPAVVEGVGGMD